MTKRLEVLQAVKAMIEAALPGMTVIGLENEGSAPERIPPNGRVIVRAGDPGVPEVDLSPIVYNYEHQIPLEIATYQSGTLSAEEALDGILDDIADAIVADRFIGGVVNFLDGYAPETNDIYVAGAEIARGADLILVASYSTDKPL